MKSIPLICCLLQPCLSITWTYPDLNLTKQPVAHSVKIPVPLSVHLEELPEDSLSSSSAVNSTHGQSDSDFKRISSVAQVFSQLVLAKSVKENSGIIGIQD